MLDLSKPLRSIPEGREAVYLGERAGLKWFSEWDGEAFETASCLPQHADEFYENVPETRELDCWVNVYESGCNTMYATKDRADTAAGYDRGARCAMRIACLHIQRTYEVGEGLS